jgi:hypothetical protein
MRALVNRGADPLFVHRVEYHAGEGAERRTQATTALMAATGMGGGSPWVAPDRSERDRLMLDAVTLAVELGIDVNAANTDGRTALDGARAAKSEGVIALLVARGAQPGASKRTP